jgi:hypothetical protein
MSPKPQTLTHDLIAWEPECSMQRSMSCIHLKGRVECGVPHGTSLLEKELERAWEKLTDDEGGKELRRQEQERQELEKS